MLFTVTRTDSGTRFKGSFSTGESGAIETTELFDLLYSDFDKREGSEQDVYVHDLISCV